MPPHHPSATTAEFAAEIFGVRQKSVTFDRSMQSNSRFEAASLGFSAAVIVWLAGIHDNGQRHPPLFEIFRLSSRRRAPVDQAWRR